MTKIYSGVFINNIGHVTYEFNPGNCRLPDGVKDGDYIAIKVVGTYN